MRLFTTKKLLEYAAVDILISLRDTKADNQFIPFMDDYLEKLTQVVYLKRATGRDVGKNWH